MRILTTIAALALFAGGALAQTNSNFEIRRFTLQEVVEAAVTNNLELQIDRFNPQIALNNIQAANAGYDPTFSLGGQHDHTESGSRLLAGGFSIPASASDDN